MSDAPAKSTSWDGAYLPPGACLPLMVVANAVAVSRKVAPLLVYRRLCAAVAATPPTVAFETRNGEVLIPREEALRLCAVGPAAPLRTSRTPPPAPQTPA